MDHLEFHDALYFTIVTVATVGFGDIYPLSVAGKFLVIILIATTIVIISNEVNILFAMLALKSVYARNVYLPPKGSPPHIIICGFVDYANLSSFLEEFYCEDHGEVEENVVVLCSSLPSVAVEFLLRMPRYRDRLSYLQGSALNERDLKRASCNTASTVFVRCPIPFMYTPHIRIDLMWSTGARRSVLQRSIFSRQCQHFTLCFHSLLFRRQQLNRSKLYSHNLAAHPTREPVPLQKLSKFLLWKLPAADNRSNPHGYIFQVLPLPWVFNPHFKSRHVDVNRKQSEHERVAARICCWRWLGALPRFHVSIF